MKNISFLLLVPFFFSSCGLIIMKSMGMKNFRILSRDDIKEASKAFKIDADKVYFFDSTYFKFIDSIKTSYPKISQNHFQPLQVMYFNREGQMVGFIVNCYAPGFPNLQWNKFGSLNVFPPSDTTKILDSLFTLKIISRFAKPVKEINQKRISSLNITDYIVVVIWTRFMGRQTQRLLNEVEQNIKLLNDRSITVLYINADNVYLHEK